MAQNICIVDYKFVYKTNEGNKNKFMSFTSSDWFECHNAAKNFVEKNITSQGGTLIYEEILSTKSFVDKG